MTEEGLDQPTRWRALLDELSVRQKLSVAEAAELLGVSAATVRRDFTELAHQQLATRTHGGIVSAAVPYGLPARYRISPDDPRERIAARAAGLVGRDGVLGFNGGTTTSAVARHLMRRADLGHGLTVVTNALNVAVELVLRPHIRTVCLGGEIRPESYELHGPWAEHVLEHLLLDQLFLGVDALTWDEGASCQHLGEAATNSLMVRHAQQVTVVAASHKLGRVALARICAVDRIDRLVTDDGADAAHVAALERAGIEVLLT